MTRRAREVVAAAALVLGTLACTSDPSPRSGTAGDGPASAPSASSAPSAEQVEVARVEVPRVAEDFAPIPVPERVMRPEPSDRVFADNKFLVAYYGTAQTATMGVLGEDAPEQAFARLEQAAAPFARPGSDVDLVFELIVTVADPIPGDDGDYSHDIPRSEVERYVEASRRLGVRLLLDLQPGRTGFLPAAKRWAWALREPHVGLALDPEWRMAPGEVPGQVIGQVDAAEVNRVSAWLADLSARQGLPEKLLVLHQFRTDMVTDIERIRPRRGLALVQHVDGFGPPGQKIDTYRAVARPKTFAMGFKLFYDEDVDLMSAAQVRALRPRVRFVSFQ